MRDISEAWHTDPVTLRDVALEPGALESAPSNEIALHDRVRFLALLNRESEALQEGLRLPEDSPDRAELLLILAQVFHRQSRLHDAAVLHAGDCPIPTYRNLRKNATNDGKKQPLRALPRQNSSADNVCYVK